MNNLPQGWSVVDEPAAPAKLPDGWQVVPDAPGMLSRLDTYMRTPIAVPTTGTLAPGMTGQEDPTGGISPEQAAELDPIIHEGAMRYGLPIAAAAAAPISGGLSLLAGAAGGFTGEVLAQRSEMERGAREKAGYGRMIAAPLVSGLPLGPEVDLGVRAFGPTGRLLAVAPQAIVKRAAFGGAIGAGASAIEQGIDENKINWNDVASSGAFGALFGGAMGGVETIQNTRAAKDAIFQLRKATNNFQGSDADFLLWAKAKARAHGATSDAQPAEEGAPVPQEQTPGLPEGYSEPSASPDQFTQDSSMVEQLPHTQPAPGSSPGPAPISPPAPPEAQAAPPPAPAPAPDAAIAEAPPPQENAELNPTAPPAPAPLPTGWTPVEPNGAIDEAAAQASNVQANPPTEPALTPAAVGGPAPAPVAEVDVNAGAGSGAASPEARASAAYKRVLSLAPGTEALWQKQQIEQIANPSRYHPVVEDENPKGLKIGDEVTIRGTDKFPESYRGIVATVQKTNAKANSGGYQVKVLPLKEGSYGGFVGLDRVEKPTSNKPVVEQTPTGPEIAPKPAEDRRVSQLSDPKQLRVQKEFLISAVKNAEKAAPIDVKMSAAGKADLAKLEKDEARLKQVAEAYGLNPEQKRDPRISLTLDAETRMRVRSKHGEHVTIEVPGDGTFRVPNSKGSLKVFAANIEKRFGKSTAKPRLPAPTTEKIQEYSAPNAGAIVKVKKKPTAEDLAAAAKLATVDVGVEERPVLHNVFADPAGYAVSTDGRRLTAIAGGPGMTQEEITAYVKKNAVKPKEVKSEFPNWRQVVPKWVKFVGGKIHVSGAPGEKLTLDTADVIKGMKQAQAVVAEKSNSVGIFKLPNGKVGFEAHSPDLGDYRSDGVNDGDTAIVSVNPQNLKEAMIAARLAGHENVKLFVENDVSPVVVLGGDNIVTVMMPMRGASSREAGAIWGTGAMKPPAAKPSGIAYQPGYGPNAKPKAEPAPQSAASAEVPAWANKPIAAQKVTQPPLMETAVSKGPIAARIEAKIAALEKLAAHVEEHEQFPSEHVTKFEQRAKFSEEALARIDKEMAPLEKKSEDEMTKEEIKRLDDLEEARQKAYEQDETAQGDLKAVTSKPLSEGLDLIQNQIELWQKRLARVNAVRLKAAHSGQLGNLPAGATPRSGGRSYASPDFGGNGLPPVASATPPPQAPFKPLRPFDNPDFTQLPIQLPEMVQFFRMISGGKNPRIVEQIRRLHGRALGVFRAIEGSVDSGRIELRADLFHLLSQQEKNDLLKKAVAWASLMKQANPDMDMPEAIRHKFEELVKQAEAEAMKRDPVRALAVFAHEIGHYIDFLPTGTLRRGNLFGHMATLFHYLKNTIGQAPDIFPFPPTDNERAALRRKAEKELYDSVKEITETITREEPIYETSGLTAKMITEVVGQTARDDFPEFYDWFAKLSRPEKVDVLKKAMKGIVDERAARFGKRVQTGTKTVTETITRPGAEITEDMIRDRYQELLREELKRRGLISLQDVKAELEAVIAWWRKTPTIPDYFRSASEMYAETFSILMNNPAALAERAPTWWKAFNAYLVRKPAIQKAYNQVQTAIKSGIIFQQRVTNLRDSWEKDEADALTKERAAEKIPWKQYKDMINLHFNKQQGPIQALAAKQLGKPESDRLLGALKDYLYRQTAVEGLARQINMRVESPLAKNDLTHNDLAEYMFHQRIVAGDAVQTANSQGLSPNTSQQRLDEMQKQLGESRFGALQYAQQQLRAIYAAGPIHLLELSQTLKPELMKKIRENVAYSPSERAREAFNPLDEGTIRGMLEASYGETATARIFRRIGSFQDIKSPYVALVKKAEALTRFAYKQIATKAMRDFLLEYNRDQIEQAPKSYNGHKLVPKDIDSPTVGTIYTLDNGDLNGWYVPRAIFETLEHASGTEQMLLGAALRVLAWPKALLTELNFGFWPVNFVRDIGGFVLQIPGGLGALKRLPQAYSAARATLTSAPNPVADQLLSRLMVISRADPRGEHLGHPDEMDRWLLRMNKHPELWEGEAKKMGMALRVWEAYKAQGQILERTTKALGMMHLDAKYGHPIPDIPGIQWVTMPEWMKKRTVNELAGSPDFNERGRGIAFVEVAGGPIFANAWLRGIEAFYKAQKQNPASVWSKWLLFFGLPALAFYAYEKGWTNLGADPAKAEEDRQMLRSVPERDKLRGFIKLIGWVDKAQGKVAYIVLPFPEQPRMLHAAWRKFLQTMGHDAAKKQGLASMVNYQAQDLPGQNPLIAEGEKWWQFAALGQNPYDSFRGKSVLDDKVFAAGQGAGELAQQTASNLLGIAIPPPIHQVPGETPTTVEKWLHAPVIANLLGRWVRVSNAGLHEQDQNAIQPVTQEEAALQIVGDEMLRKDMNGEKRTDSENQLYSTKPYLMSYMHDRVRTFIANAAGPEVDDFMKANNEEKAALLKMWADREALKQQRLNAGVR